ncbi:hypothetical protein RSP03_33090 [Cereibacter sphaeroides]|nr:hypothetical protein RSP03_33090 [Cereibacter sphaeroides]
MQVRRAAQARQPRDKRLPAILLFPVAAFSAAQAPDAAGVAADQKLGEARISREAGPSAPRRSMTSPPGYVEKPTTSPQPSTPPSAGAAHQNLSERNPTVASTIRTATKVSAMLTVATAAAVGSKL